MSSPKTGALIGAIAGLVFIQVNAGSLPGGLAAAVRGLGVVAFIAVVTLTVLWRGEEQPGPAPDQRAWRTYGSAVIFEVIMIPLGIVLLTLMHHQELILGRFSSLVRTTCRSPRPLASPASCLWPGR